MTAPRDCNHLEQTHAFADGELAGSSADAAREHLATCGMCQAELAELLQLDAAVDAVAHRQAADVISLAWYRRRVVQVAAIALAVAAVVAIYAALPQPAPGRALTSPVALGLAPHRAVEARLAWPGAAGHRPYDVPRAGEPPHESIAMRTLADLEARGDLHGVGALALLNGERQRAADYLARSGDSAGALADRAALALAEQQPERALAHADAALARDPAHGPALWNRALALRDLGLGRAAAAGFRAVAGRGEPGWADEARQRASVLDAETDAVEQRFAQLQRARAGESDPLLQRRSREGQDDPREREALELQQQAEAALAANDAAGALAILLRGQERCATAGAPAYHCARIGLRLGDLYLASRRLPEARAALSGAWKLARAAGEWGVQRALLSSLAALASQSDDAATGPSLARAYTEERALRPGDLSAP